MADKFRLYVPDLDSPFQEAFPITPNDEVLFANTTRGLWVGTGGNVHVQMMGYFGGPGSNVVFYNIQSGTELRVRALRVFSSNTTASDIVGAF